MKCLLKLYPAAWQQRYGPEMEAHLEAEAPSVRTALDLVAGAIDARLNPALIQDTGTREDVHSMIHASRHEPADISRTDAVRGTVWLLGLTLALVIAAVTLDKTVGPHMTIDAMLYSAFFIAFSVSSRLTYLKPYSNAARTLIITVISVAWYGFFFGVTALAKLT